MPLSYSPIAAAPAPILDRTALPLATRMLLADARKFWACAPPRAAWAQLARGTQVLLIRASRQHEPWQDATEAAQVLENRLGHPTAPRLVMAWGQAPASPPDTRLVAVLRPNEVHTMVPYKV